MSEKRKCDSSNIEAYPFLVNDKQFSRVYCLDCDWSVKRKGYIDIH